MRYVYVVVNVFVLFYFELNNDDDDDFDVYYPIEGVVVVVTFIKFFYTFSQFFINRLLFFIRNSVTVSSLAGYSTFIFICIECHHKTTTYHMDIFFRCGHPRSHSYPHNSAQTIQLSSSIQLSA